jgi:hypothetical protein
MGALFSRPTPEAALEPTPDAALKQIIRRAVDIGVLDDDPYVDQVERTNLVDEAIGVRDVALLVQDYLGPGPGQPELASFHGRLARPDPVTMHFACVPATMHFAWVPRQHVCIGWVEGLDRPHIYFREMSDDDDGPDYPDSDDEDNSICWYTAPAFGLTAEDIWWGGKFRGWTDKNAWWRIRCSGPHVFEVRSASWGHPAPIFQVTEADQGRLYQWLDSRVVRIVS